ncbi:hypothetical protein RJT34_18219 [Clitoria ternatea]|uniref:Glycosyltransferase n=1 Tax=Clitoria ternatea TaxID=43366 RepID=A0AAN9JAP9_CLITE
MEDQPTRVHIAVFPWLAYGHLSPFFEVSKLIAQKGHKVFFISTPRNIKRLPKVPVELQHLLEFVELPLPHVDKLPENVEATMDIPGHIVQHLKKAFDGLQETLAKFLEKSTPDWIIYDFAPHWLPPICSKLGIPCILFLTFSANSLCHCLSSYPQESSFCKSPETIALQPFEDKILDEHDVPNESGVSDMFRVHGSISGADILAIRSCREIEGESFRSLENYLKKPVIPTGLLPPSTQFSDDTKDENWLMILNWLDKQEKMSVVYVAFGSEATLSNEDFTEVARGLELSGIPYFWVLKEQISLQRSVSVELKDWLENKSNKHGLVWRTWAPQLRILAHKSIGGFLSHCGWSSVIESLQVGCPLIMLPLHNDQGFVARLVENKKAGVKVPRSDHDGKFTRDSVAKALRSMMLEEDGETYRSQAEEMSKIFGDKELHQKYLNDFVGYIETNRPATKH